MNAVSSPQQQDKKIQKHISKMEEIAVKILRLVPDLEGDIKFYFRDGGIYRHEFTHAEKNEFDKTKD